MSIFFFQILIIKNSRSCKLYNLMLLLGTSSAFKKCLNGKPHTKPYVTEATRAGYFKVMLKMNQNYSTCLTFVVSSDLLHLGMKVSSAHYMYVPCTSSLQTFHCDHSFTHTGLSTDQYSSSSFGGGTSPSTSSGGANPSCDKTE
jgi:hypothetical protein